jgi:hypothetical protein
MKKILFIAFALVVTCKAMAQQADTVYVFFTPTDSETQGVWQDIDDDYNAALYRGQTRDYTLFSRPEGYFFMFTYLPWKDEPEDPILVKPWNFLRSIEYIDWNDIGPTLTKEQAQQKIDEILSYDKIYFVVIRSPAPPIVANTQSVATIQTPTVGNPMEIELVPVGPLVSRF